MEVWFLEVITVSGLALNVGVGLAGRHGVEKIKRRRKEVMNENMVGME